MSNNEALVEVLENGQGNRVAIYYDNEAECPLLWWDNLGCQVISSGRHISDFGTTEENDWHSDLVRDLIRDHKDTYVQEELEQRIREYFDGYGEGEYAVSFRTLRGATQGDWAKVVFYGESSEDLDRAARYTEAWFAGEVFFLAHEVEVIYTSPKGNTKKFWELADDEALSGNYLDPLPKTYEEALAIITG